MAKTSKPTKKRVVKVEPLGRACIFAMGFRGSKKNTPYAAQMAAEDCGKVAYDLGLRKVKVFVKGPGSGRESAIRAINGCGIEVTEIVDITPLPHNGCRPPKRRRV